MMTRSAPSLRRLCPATSEPRRRSAGRCWIAAFAWFALVACSTGDHAPPVGPGVESATAGAGTDTGSTGVDSCAAPGRAGCPCSDPGATAPCGKIIEKSGDYVTCSTGHSRCNGQTWGECTGDHFYIKSIPNPSTSLPSTARPLSTAVPCTNACDPACNSIANTAADVDASGLVLDDGGGLSLGPADATPGTGPCRGLFCQIATCDGGAKTTLTGTVYDPAGKVPLYNAYVYVPIDPTAPLPPFTSGVSCDTCAGAGNLAVVALAQSGPDGTFTLSNVPSGTNIPLVVQIGNWRRKVTLPEIAPCTTTALDKSYTRLPRNHTDGDGNYADIPKIAIATGSADPFECLLLKAGIDPNEIQFPGGGGRIDYYVFNGIDRAPGGAPDGSVLTSSLATLEQYNAVLLPCEGAEVDGHAADVGNLATYTDLGGRVFVTHFGYSWLATPYDGTARDLSEYYGTANWQLEPRPGNYSPFTVSVDQSFPKGQAFAQWLMNVGASSALGQLAISEPRHDATSAITPPSQRWLYGWWPGTSTSNPPNSLMAMTFNTPTTVSADKQCGRVVYSDFHVSANALVNRWSDACNDDTDCGFGATCSPPVYGTCSTQCSTDFDCGNRMTCQGATVGTCQPRPCRGFGSGTCPRRSMACTAAGCSCSRDWQCASGERCNGGSCTPAQACATDDDCGSSETCAGGVAGTCTKACATDADCAGTNLTCINGQCQGCLSDNDCPGFNSWCAGAQPSECSASGSMFPLSCRNGDLSADEKALEFMLFDLTACVSPDSYTPGSPTTTYSPVTFTQDFTADCNPADAGTLSGDGGAHGKQVVWREFDWQASIPDSASIAFSFQSADTVADLPGAPTTQSTTASTSTALPNWDAVALDTATGAFHSVDPPVASRDVLRVTITMNPTSDAKVSPSLMQWKVQYDCADAE